MRVLITFILTSKFHFTVVPFFSYMLTTFILMIIKKIIQWKDSFQEGHEKINPWAFAIRIQFKTTNMHCYNTPMHYKLRFKAVIK